MPDDADNRRLSSRVQASNLQRLAHDTAQELSRDLKSSKKRLERKALAVVISNTIASWKMAHDVYFEHRAGCSKLNAPPVTKATAPPIEET